MIETTTKFEGEQIMQLSVIETIKRVCATDFYDDCLTGAYNTLRIAVKLFIDSDESQSEKLLRELLSTSDNGEIRTMALDILFALLVWQDRFDELEALGLPRNDQEAEQVELYDSRETEFLLSPECTVVDMPETPWIQPFMTVQINGKSYHMMIDTGALITVVTKSVAEQCNLVLEEKNVEVGIATEGVAVSQKALIGELMIGKSTIKHKQCLIMPDEALDFSSVGGPQIDGIIGWEVIQRLYWEIDYQNRKVKVRGPRQADVTRNMCCDFYPMVKIVINGDETIITGFDTGATGSIFGKSLVGRFSGVEKTTHEMKGIGQSGPGNYSGYKIPKLPIEIGGTRLTLLDAFIYDDREEYNHAQSLISGGNLGSDAAIGKVLVIDYQNRHLSISSSFNREKVIFISPVILY